MEMTYLNTLPSDLHKLLLQFCYPTVETLEIQINDCERIDYGIYVYTLIIRIWFNTSLNSSKKSFICSRIDIYIVRDEVEEFIDFLKKVCDWQDNASIGITEDYDIFSYFSKDGGILNVRSYVQHTGSDFVYLHLTGDIISSFCKKMIEFLDNIHPIDIGKVFK